MLVKANARSEDKGSRTRAGSPTVCMGAMPEADSYPVMNPSTHSRPCNAKLKVKQNQVMILQQSECQIKFYCMSNLCQMLRSYSLEDSVYIEQ